MRHGRRWVSRAIGIFVLAAAAAVAQGSSKPEWAAQLTPEQEMLVGQLFLDRLHAIGVLERGPGRLRQAREIERRLQEKLAEFLTPEQLSGYRAGVPSILADEPNVKLATAGQLCNDGYAALEQACTQAALARDAGESDYAVHSGHNSYSLLDRNAGRNLKQYACEARDIAAAARTNCELADDAAARADTAIAAARQQFQYAVAAADYCYNNEDGEINYEANYAALYAEAAEDRLVIGRDAENACHACCSPDVDAPGTINGIAQGPNSIKVTWQDRSNETHFEVQRSINGGGYGTIATKPREVEQHVDGAGSAENNNRYRVRAVNQDCGLQGPWSVIAIVPKAPSNLTFTRTGNTVTLRWNDRSTLETNFEIHRKLGSQPWVLFQTVPAGTESKPGIALQPGVNRFRVLAKTPTGKSWFTNEVSVTY